MRTPPKTVPTGILAAWLVAAILLTLAVRLPSAAAHGGLPISQNIMWSGDTMVVPTPYWGLFVGTDGGPWRWICDEAINPNQLRLISMSSDGKTFYATDTSGLTLSPDGGCSWAPVQGTLAMLDVVSVVADPVDPKRAYVLANSSDNSANTGLWRTDDAGATWKLIRPLGTDLPNGLAVSYDGSMLAVVSLSQAQPRTATVHLSTDAGAGFTSQVLNVPLMGMPLTNLTPLWFDSPAPGTGSLYLRSILDTSQLLFRWDRPGDPVLALNTPLRIFAMARDPEKQSLLVASSGGLFVQQSDGSFKLIDALSSVQCVSPHKGQLYVCASNYSPDYAAIARLKVSADQATKIFQYDEGQGPIDCPPTTKVGSLCPGLWANYANQLGVVLATPDMATAAPMATSSCQLSTASTGAASGGGLAALAVLLLSLRRRRR
jgi:MYXO-CTERM domain-containing protein